MWSGVIVYIIGVIAGHCYGDRVYTNDCGTVTVAEPAIDGKRVLCTFVPKNQTDIREGHVEWKYSDYAFEYEVTNIPRYNMSAYNASFMLDLLCLKHLDSGRDYLAEYSTLTWRCRSEWFDLTVLKAPAYCGILYRTSKKILNANEVVMEYYAPDSVLENGQYVRLLRRKTSAGCDDVIGCAVDVTWFEEDYSEYNSKYVYRIHNFTDEMNGNYTLQCTNRTHDNKNTNYVKLVIPVAPKKTTFLNTKDIDGNENCIAEKENEVVAVLCEVKGGTFPMFVKMYFTDDETKGECSFYEGNVAVVCEWRLKLSNDFHLRGIRCEVSNDATVGSITTTATLYVILKPLDPYLYNTEATEGSKIDIKCKCFGSQPTPVLHMLVDGQVINSTFESVGNLNTIKLNYLHRNWNGASLKCCMQHLYYDKPRCSFSKKLKYQFSPKSTEILTLTTVKLDRKDFSQTLQCAVINANPACNVNWIYPSSLQVVIGAVNETKPSGQGGFTTTSTLQFNGKSVINSQEMNCQAICDVFNVTSMAKYNILIPYAPIITTNASKDTIWNIGDTVMIKCYADSFPLANLSWFDTDNNTMATSNCGENAKCMEIKNVQMTDAGIYTCMAETELFDTVNQTFELAIIISTRNAIKQGHDKEKIKIPWITVGIAASILMAVLAVIIAVFIVTKRRKRSQIKIAPGNVSMDVIDQNSNHCSENIGSDIDTYDNIQDVTNANTTDNTIPSDAASPGSDDGSEYAVVIPKSQRQTKELRDIDTSMTIKQDTHNLVYADLDLITDGTTTNAYVPSDELATEYVSIDFNRVGEKLSDVETENIYANQ